MQEHQLIPHFLNGREVGRLVAAIDSIREQFNFIARRLNFGRRQQSP